MMGRGRYAHVVSIALGLSAAAVAAGCVHGQRRSELPPAADGDQMLADDQVGVDDMFEVRVYGESELSGTYRVATDGTIDFPLAGRIPVVGLRTGQIQQRLTEKLRGGYLKNPQVTVLMKEWNSRKISVLGQVQKPGSVAYYPHMTIVDAIAQAGGFTGIAAKNSVSLRRELGGKVESHIYPVADITEGRSSNVLVLPGDVLVVEERLF